MREIVVLCRSVLLRMRTRYRRSSWIAVIRIHSPRAGLLEIGLSRDPHYELKKAGLEREKEVGVPVRYEDVRLDLGFRGSDR